LNSSDLYSGKRFRQATQYFLLGRTAQAIASLMLTLWLVRVLAPTDYGIYMVLWGMVEMMVPLSSLGLLEAVRRYLPELATRGAPGELVWFVRWMTLIRFTIMAAWVALIAYFWSDIAGWMGFSEPQQDATLLSTGLIITVIGFRYTAEMLECLLEQRWSQLIHVFMPLGRLIGTAILVVIDSLTLELLIWLDLIISLGCFLLAEFFLLRKLRDLPNTGDFRINFSMIASFAWHMAGVNLLNAISSAGALRILVARMLGLEAAGMFALLQQLLMFIGRYLPARLLANIIRPMLISRYVAGNIDIVQQGMALLWKSNLLVIAACMVTVIVAGDSLISLASGGRFMDAGMLMLIMLLGLGATNQGQLVIMIMQIFPYTRQLRYFSFLSMVTPLAVIIGSNWELIGVACGIVLTVWLQNSLTLLWLNRQAGSMSLDWPGILRGLSIAVLLTIIGLIIESEFGVWWGLVAVLVGYVPGLILVKPLNQFDKALLNRGLQHRAYLLSPFVWKG
jgi:O-antigen/teichoic acid export membrane protein